MQERAEFNERKNSNDSRNAGYKGKELILPDRNFDGNMTLYFGGLTFQITPEGRGHSTGDLTVYIPQKRVMLMGDLLDTEFIPGKASRRAFFIPMSNAGFTFSIISWHATYPSKPTFRVTARPMSAGVRKISKNKSATSSS